MAERAGGERKVRSDMTNNGRRNDEQWTENTCTQSPDMEIALTGTKSIYHVTRRY